MSKSEDFALIFVGHVWLLVKTVTGGASDDWGEHDDPFRRALEPEQMNQKSNKFHISLARIFYIRVTGGDYGTYPHNKEFHMKNMIVIMTLLFLVIGCSTEAKKGQESQKEMPPAGDTSASRYSGIVLSSQDASNYTYLEIKGKDGVFWAAIPQTKIPAGASVELIAPNVMKNFESKVLGKKFETIIFASGATVNGTHPEKVTGAPPAKTDARPGALQEPSLDASAHMKADTATDASEVKKAEGGVTIAEILANPASFRDKKVLLRGKVVKFLPEIMKKNWLHLKDASIKDKDITATSAEQFKVGEVVLIEGVVKTNQDLGYGYKYDVLIEEASIKGK